MTDETGFPAWSAGKSCSRDMRRILRPANSSPSGTSHVTPLPQDPATPSCAGRKRDRYSTTFRLFRHRILYRDIVHNRSTDPCRGAETCHGKCSTRCHSSQPCGEGLMTGEATHAAGAASKRLLVARHALVVVVVPGVKDRAVKVWRRLLIPTGFVDLCSGRARRGEIFIQFPASCNSQAKENDDDC